MSEVITQEMIETGQSIAKRGAELSRLASEVVGIFRGEDSLAGAIGGLGRQATREQEIRDNQIGVIGEAESLLGSVSHDKWRNENFSTDIEGVYRRRVKCIVEREGKDVWVNMDEVNDGEDVLFAQDIANTNFEDLHPHWQKDNFDAAKVVVAILLKNIGVIDLEDPEVYQSVGTEINEAWKERSSWIEPGLEPPFSELPQQQQEKDISQVRTALTLFSQ